MWLYATQHSSEDNRKLELSETAQHGNISIFMGNSSFIQPGSVFLEHDDLSGQNYKTGIIL